MATKEDIFPSKADKFVFAAAPFVVLMSTFLLVVVLPAGPDAFSLTSMLESILRWQCHQFQ